MVRLFAWLLALFVGSFVCWLLCLLALYLTLDNEAVQNVLITPLFLSLCVFSSFLALFVGSFVCLFACLFVLVVRFLVCSRVCAVLVFALLLLVRVLLVLLLALYVYIDISRERERERERERYDN